MYLFLQILITLHGSRDYVFVNVEESGYVSSYSPRTTAGDVQTMVYVSSVIYMYMYLHK